jgi:hypothetical protein
MATVGIIDCADAGCGIVVKNEKDTANNRPQIMNARSFLFILPPYNILSGYSFKKFSRIYQILK